MTKYIDQISAFASARRFDNWSIWKTLWLTNPLVVGMLNVFNYSWRGWYVKPPR